MAMYKHVVVVFFVICCFPMACLSKAIVVCDYDRIPLCQKELLNFRMGKNNIEWKMISLNDNYVDNIKSLDQMISPETVDVIIAFGRDIVVTAAIIVAKTYNLPILTYNLERTHTTGIYQDFAINLRPSMYKMGQTVAQFIESNTSDTTCILTNEHHLDDGFIDGFLSANSNKTDIKKMVLQQYQLEDMIVLYQTLQSIGELGIKIIIVNMETVDATLVIKVSKRLGYFRAGFVWIFSEICDSSNDLPSGILLIKTLEIDGIQPILRRSLQTAADFMTSTSLSSFSYHSTANEFKSFIASRTYSVRNTGLSFENYLNTVVRANVTFSLLNLVVHNTMEWSNVGYIGDYTSDIDVIHWPGNTLFGPIKPLKKFFRIVTRPAHPFVFIRGPIGPTESCYGDTVCLQVKDGNPIFINSPYRFLEPYDAYNFTYELYCCNGIVVDIVESLSKDLDFDFQIYFRNFSQSMDDLLTSIEEEQAHILAAPVTITSMRAMNILFTEPFLFSGFAMVVPVNNYQTSMVAFMMPFDTPVWLMILASATVVALTTSLFEWNSPFGLNPWARKRTKNYTLGSGLVMVYSVLFGHTVSTKSPKSWPSKVLQNFWAALAIITFASYTANLAAYLAGNSAVKDIDNIYQIGNKQVYAKSSSAAMKYLDVLNRISSKKIKVNAVSDEETITQTIQKLRDNAYDVFIDDRPFIEYALSQHDNCTIKVTGSGFGENLYAFGLSMDAVELREKISSLILHYVEGGFTQKVIERYIRKRECEGMKEIYNQQYGLEHTGGLFLMLIGAMFLSGLLLFAEHCAFKYLVPYARKKPHGSIFKNRNVEFVNQRLYRVINSEELISPKETAREMMRFIKDRQFVRVFQKNEIKQASRQQREALKGVRFYNLYNKLMSTSYRPQFSISDSVFTTDSSANLYSISEDDSNAEEKFIEEAVKGEEKEQSLSNVKPKRSFKITGLPRRSRTFNYPKNNSFHKRWSFQFRKPKQSDEVTINPLWALKKPPSSFREENESKHLPSSTLKQNHTQTKSYGAFNKRPCSWPDLGTCAYAKEKSEQDKRQDEVRSCSSSGGVDYVEMKDFKRKVDTPTNGTHRSLASTDRNSNYYGRSLKMKDNRVKSTIRRHALAKFRRHSSSIFDECAVDALTKEDLLILWKKSEIELETQLNRISLQNVRLKRLLRIAEDTGNVLLQPDESGDDSEDDDGVFQNTRL